MTVQSRMRTIAVWLGVAAILLLHASLALLAVSKKSVTSDEILHVTAGYSYWRFNDYRLQPENGNLPQRVAGLGALLAGASPPQLENNVYWRTSDSVVMGYQFFYESGNDHWPMLMAARAAMLVFSLATGVLIFLWSRALFGAAPAFFSLSLYALCPNFLAHDPLATSDSAAVFFLLAAVGAFWRHLRRPTVRTGLLSAVTLGLACVAKFSAAFLAPIFVILIGWRLALEPSSARRDLLRRLPISCVGHLVVAWAIIWAFYGFRFAAAGPGVPAADHFIAPWERVLPFIGLQANIVEFCRTWKLLPDSFLFGYAWVVQSAKARGAFLAGDYSIFGWKEFFPLAFLWKTPLATLAALVVGAVALWCHWFHHRLRILSDLAHVAPLLVLGIVYWIFAVTSHLNIGHRHILPTYPPLFILLGGLIAAGCLLPKLRILVFAAVLLSEAVATLRVHPHYIAFFNSFAGGPANGYRLLVDSSLDWGQDLPALAEWLRQHAGNERVYLSYFGSGEPDYYRISATRLPFLNGFKLPPKWYQPGPGIYCISATMLQQVYSSASGPWTPEREKEYQQLRESGPLFRRYFTDPSSHAELEREIPPEQWLRAWKRYDSLRFARLCHHLRARKPDAMIGYSILVYRLTPADLHAAIDGSFSEWLHGLERLQGQ